jgi:hypothetical protein
MVKTLRITTVVATLLAIAIFALPVRYGIRNDENANKFLNSPAIIAAFKASDGNRTKTTTNQVHPLVQQAQDFSSIINPPKPVMTANNTIKPTFGKTVVDLPSSSTPKFTVKGISYYELKPEMSLALIDEPGKGTYWVRQSSTVNHLLIEQVKEGFIVVRNGEETFELKTEERKVAAPLPKGVIPAIKSGNPTSKSVTPTRLTARPVTNTAASKTETEEERSQKASELVDKIKEIENKVSEDPNFSQLSTEERVARMQKLIAEYKNSNMNISEKESKSLSDLGVMLGNVKDINSGN